MTFYKEILNKVFEKLPFHEYLLRLYSFILEPNIRDDYRCRIQLTNAGIDIFNALGLLIATVSVMILVDNDYNYFKIIKALNPLYITASYILYALYFSSLVAFISATLMTTKWSLASKRWLINFDLIFAHCLRNYAAVGFFLGIPYIVYIGQLLYLGKSPDEVFSNIYWWLYLLLTLIVLPFRLLINPIYYKIKFSKFKPLGWFLIIFIIWIVSFLNTLIPNVSHDQMLNKEELCKFFRSGAHYKSLTDDRKKMAEKYFCKNNFTDTKINK